MNTTDRAIKMAEKMTAKEKAAIKQVEGRAKERRVKPEADMELILDYIKQSHSSLKKEEGCVYSVAQALYKRFAHSYTNHYRPVWSTAYYQIRGGRLRLVAALRGTDYRRKDYVEQEGLCSSADVIRRCVEAAPFHGHCCFVEQPEESGYEAAQGDAQ